MSRDYITDKTIAEKESLRNEIRRIRKALTKEYITEKSSLICDALMSLECYKEADIIFAYSAHNGEPDMGAVIEKSLEAGKKVALPRVEGDNIAFYYISSERDLNAGYMGIREPDGRFPADTAGRTLLIVPGLAYDRNGTRSGFGGGYYDRYLAGAGTAFCAVIAPAFDFQIYDRIPSEEHDMKAGIIVTPEETIEVKG